MGLKRFIQRLRWLFLLLALPAISTARAELIFDVFVGYGLGASDGVIAEAQWFPVTCEIYNDGPAFHGSVEIIGGQFGSGQPRLVKLELPTGTKKRFTVPIFASARYRLAIDAKLRNEQGKLMAQHQGLEPVKYVDWQNPLIASLPRTHGGAAMLPEGVGNRVSSGPAITRLSPEFFPENPIALEGIETLYVNSSRALELKQPQASALLAWLHGGGNLIVAIEQPSDLGGLPWLAGVLPCQVSGIATLANHAALQRWLNDTESTKDELLRPGTPRARPGGTAPAANLNPFQQLATDPLFEEAALPIVTATVRDGEVLVGTREMPLVISAARGRGNLVVLLFSPELEPFRSWKNKSWFWARAGGAPMAWLNSANVSSAGTTPLDGVFGAMIDSKQIRKLPVGWLLLLLVAYLIVIGPLDHYWLKRINKQMLTWITFPTYVVLFSGLIYFIGYSLRSGEAEWNELHIVDVVAHGERADLRGRTYGSAYSPANARYPVSSAQPFATLRGEVGQGTANEISKLTLEQRGHSFDAELTVPVWTSQLYLSDWWKQEATPVIFQVMARGDFWDLQVENRSGKTIRQAKLIIDGRVHDVAITGRNLSVSRHGGETLTSFLQRYFGHMSSAVMSRQQQFGSQHGGRLGDVLNYTTAASFLGGLPLDSGDPQGMQFHLHDRFVSPRGFDLTPVMRRNQAILILFLPGESIVPPLNQFTPRHSRSDTILRVTAPIPSSR